MHPTIEATTPDDFPRDHGLGAVSGVQPKLIVRKTGDAYVQGLTTDDRNAGYDMCFDLVNQLTDYCTRKMKDRPDWSFSDLCVKVETTLRSRSDWGLSEGEVRWGLDQLSRRMS